MLTYLTRRLVQGVIVLLAVSFVCFIIFRYMGDPVISMAGQYATAAERDEIRKIFGLDQPPYVQYWRFLTNALHGNFGISYETRLPALGLIVERIPASAELAASAMVFAFTVGVWPGCPGVCQPPGLAEPGGHGRFARRHLDPHLPDRHRPDHGICRPAGNPAALRPRRNGQAGNLVEHQLS